MCCIFTCCGWMIDLFQRLWTFTMSCCISSAVCCALVTASMSGIAMGYNYSLAEYIDLKETNVSVYLKRGVFDDEIADDIDWRRSGHMPVQGHLKDSNLVTGEPVGPDEMPMLRSGRRLDDSLIASDNQHNFEGSLMRLTAKPPDARRHETPEPVTSDTKLEEILVKYPMGSLDQMKAIHSLMNQRNAASERHTTMSVSQTSESYEADGRRVIHPGYMRMDSGPAPNDYFAKQLNPQQMAARVAVPDEGFREVANWLLPKNQVPDAYRRTMDLPNYDLMPNPPLTRPQPIRMSTEIFRPTIPHRTTLAPMVKPKYSFSDQESANEDNLQRDITGDKPGPGGFKSESDYEELANRGLPIRKKRNRRDAVKESFISKESQVPSTNSDVNESNGIKSTRSALMIKLKSSINKDAEESSSNKLSISSLLFEEISPKTISRFVSLH